MGRMAFAVLLLFPAYAVADAPKEDVQAKIALYEARLEKNPGFDWAVHNELRHLYLGIDEERSMHHSDVILAHSVMDDYILRILSGWQLEKDFLLARANLQLQLDKGHFKFVEAASMIKLGELAELRDDPDEARFYYQTVEVNRDPELAAYRSLAEVRRRRMAQRLGPDWRAWASRYSFWGLAGSPVVALVWFAWAFASRRRLRERLAQSARALGSRRCYEVCYRSEDSAGGFRLWPWDKAGLLLAHRGKGVFVSERGGSWLGEGFAVVWKGRRAGAPWFALEGRGAKHYFTAEPGIWPFGSEGATRSVLARLEEDLALKGSPGPRGPGASPGKVRGSAL